MQDYIHLPEITVKTYSLPGVASFPSRDKSEFMFKLRPSLYISLIPKPSNHMKLDLNRVHYKRKHKLVLCKPHILFAGPPEFIAREFITSTKYKN